MVSVFLNGRRVMKRRNFIAKAVRTIRSKVIKDKRREASRKSCRKK